MSPRASSTIYPVNPLPGLVLYEFTVSALGKCLNLNGVVVLPALRWFPQLIKVLAEEPHRCGSFGEDEGRGDKQRGGAEG